MQVVKFGPRQSINSVGGISAKQSGDDLKEICPPQCIMLSGPYVSTHSSTLPSNLTAASIRTTAREVSLGRPMSKTYKKTRTQHPPAEIQIPSSFGFLASQAEAIITQRIAQVRRCSPTVSQTKDSWQPQTVEHLPAVALIR